jgi:hypothetical protein
VAMEQVANCRFTCLVMTADGLGTNHPTTAVLLRTEFVTATSSFVGRLGQGQAAGLLVGAMGRGAPGPYATLGAWQGCQPEGQEEQAKGSHGAPLTSGVGLGVANSGRTGRLAHPRPQVPRRAVGLGVVRAFTGACPIMEDTGLVNPSACRQLRGHGSGSVCAPAPPAVIYSALMALFEGHGARRRCPCSSAVGL